jgi:hypothetical protein
MCVPVGCDVASAKANTCQHCSGLWCMFDRERGGGYYTCRGTREPCNKHMWFWHSALLRTFCSVYMKLTLSDRAIASLRTGCTCS